MLSFNYDIIARPTHTAREFADPTVSSGLIKPSATEASDSFHASMKELSKTINPSKIFYLQISDGARILDPQRFQADAAAQGMPPLYLWSNKHRPLPYSRSEWRGYLPVLDVIKAVLRTGWRGVWSYEVFFEEDQAKEDPDVPDRWTKEAWVCHQKIMDALSESCIWIKGVSCTLLSNFDFCEYVWPGWSWDG